MISEFDKFNEFFIFYVISCLVKNKRKSFFILEVIYKLEKLEGTCYEKIKSIGIYTLILFLNRMRQKAPVRFRRDTI